MKPSILKAVEITLAVAVAVMLCFLVVPWRQTPEMLTSTPPRPGVPVDVAKAQTPAPLAASETIVSLFTKVAATPAPSTPAPTPAPAPEAKKAQDATWLTLVGTATGSDGKPSFAFKDSRSGRIIRVVQGETVGGWSISDISDKQITLSNNGELYLVKTR